MKLCIVCNRAKDVKLRTFGDVKALACEECATDEFRQREIIRRASGAVIK